MIHTSNNNKATAKKKEIIREKETFANLYKKTFIIFSKYRKKIYEMYTIHFLSLSCS